MSELTRILTALERGDTAAAGQLLPLVYDELRRLAAQKLAQERPGQTLEATAQVGLVNEGRGVEALSGLFQGQPARGQPAQLVVDQGQQLAGRLGVALLGGPHDSAGIGHGTDCKMSPVRRQ